MDLFSHMEENKGPADGSVAWALLILCSLDLFGPTKWSEELTEKSAFWTCSVLQERMERLADGSAAWTFPVRCSMGLFRSYEVEWETCRVELQFGVFQSCTRE